MKTTVQWTLWIGGFDMLQTYVLHCSSYQTTTAKYPVYNACQCGLIFKLAGSLFPRFSFVGGHGYCTVLGLKA